MEDKPMNRLWELVSDYQKMDPDSILASIAQHLEFSQGKNRYTAEDFDIYESLALSIRDRLIEFLNDTQQTYHTVGCKQIYFLSLEYLMGRTLGNSLINLGIYDACQKVLESIGYHLNDLEEIEHDAGLGNGGLGRLAACFLDSLATLQLPAWGYGIRYEYGIFRQKIENNEQIEYPDNWLVKGSPWEIPRWEMVFPVQFYGKVQSLVKGSVVHRCEWIDTQDILAMAYDVPIPGYQTHTVNNLRLWSAKPVKDFDFHLFNSGDYMKAVEDAQKSETLSKVLYPNDQGFAGKELRLKQQFFFVSASLQDIIRRFKNSYSKFHLFPEKVAIQLNDTHPSIAIPELMRLLIDIEGITWENAWSITQKVFSYTNHTVLPEALEKWSVEMFGNLLPRHLQIIYEINQNFLETVKNEYPDQPDLLKEVCIIEEGPCKMIRMPHLAIVASHTVNGVSQLHTNLLKTTVLKNFNLLYPQRFQNKTNGITPRRWLKVANPELSELLDQVCGKKWCTCLEDLKQLIPLADDLEFQNSWQYVKSLKKQQFAYWIKKQQGIEIDPSFLFDVQIKRIHEYKRQLLCLLHVITLYNSIRSNPSTPIVPRVIIFGGKAAPGYYMAKLIIQLTNDVAQVVNNDPVTQGKLQVVFLENYGVSVAEKIIPATELSEHISTAGTEASGTSNMKFALNGSIIIGTIDGANIEIHDAVGEENLFSFGHSIDEIQALRQQGYEPEKYIRKSAKLQKILHMINTGYFHPQDPYLYQDLYNSLVHDDQYMLLADYKSYIQCQKKVSKTYQDACQWTKMSILNTANMGKFSSDRTIQEYAKDIWNIQPVPIKSGIPKIR